MPLYEFRCKKCKNVFETIAYPGEEITCPACDGKVERLFSKFSFGQSSNKTSARSSGGSGGKCSTCPGGNCSTCK